MNAHATPAQALNFRARSLLAFVLEPTQPVADWFAALDAWLVRSPTFFAAKPVILEMAGIELGLKEYRNLLSGLALRHIRVMGVENASQALVGPHLPPAVTGGRNVSAPAMLEEGAPAPSEPTKTEKTEKPEKTESLIVDGNVRSGQSIVHPDGDVTIVGRVRIGRRNHCGRVDPCLWRPAGARHRRDLGLAHCAKFSSATKRGPNSSASAASMSRPRR